MYEHLILGLMILANIGLTIRLLCQKPPVQPVVVHPPEIKGVITPATLASSNAIINCVTCGKAVARYNTAGVCANCAPTN
jgi:hypothetical protein